MFSKKYFFIFLVVYLAERLFSYFFGPETPLQPQTWVNTALAGSYLAITAYLLIRKNIWGWGLVALELILGGAGGFLSLGPLSLRTCLLFVSMAIFDAQKAMAGEYIKKLKHNLPVTLGLAVLFIVVGASALNGYLAGHELKAVFSDTVPYLFLLYYYPLRDALGQDKFKKIIWSALPAAILGNGIFILFTITGFSVGFFTLQDSFYHWYRDVALGKITEVGLGFYRLVLNEQLLLAPLILYFLYRLINKKNKLWIDFSLLSALLFILSLNLTRSYLLGLAVGALFLLNKINWKRWLIFSATTLFAFAVIFTTTHLLTTRGQSLGWEIFGLRLQSVVQPQIEESSLSRMLLLPKILEKIQSAPLLGSGLGDVITVYSPTFKKDIATSHFDWGYLEIWTEMGIIGLVVWGVWITIFLRQIWLRKDQTKYYLFSALVALLIINITSPALFHVMGTIFIASLLSHNRNFIHLT